MDQQCRKQCQVDVDCPYGEICTSAQTCVKPNQVDSNTVPDGGVSATGGSPGAGGTGGSPDAFPDLPADVPASAGGTGGSGSVPDSGGALSSTPDASPDLPADVSSSTGGVVSAGGSGGGSNSDAALAVGGDSGGTAVLCVDNSMVRPSLCTSTPALPSVTDLSGTWVLETIGAQTVTVMAYANPFRLKSIGVILVQVTQTGSDVAVAGHYCDRVQNDDSTNPAKVVVPEAWAHTPFPIQRSGTFADNGSGQLELVLPTAIEVAGANLADPACDALPSDPNDPRVVDIDNDGFPGLTVNLTGSFVAGSLMSVQRQATTLHGVAVAADRIEGGLTYESDQSVLESDPASIKSLYLASKSSADPAVCASSFVMVKVSAADAGAVDCDWVRANEAALLGL
jgi:hypothetical protein